MARAKQQAKETTEAPVLRAGGADAMLPALFVDRPRLAVVLAVLTALAGALALRVIPVSHTGSG